MVNGFITNEPDPERYTPPGIVIGVKETLRTIDLDPASTELVNRTFIRAKKFYTKEQNGLNRDLPWQGKLYINPPGGDKLPQFFWDRLILEYNQGNVTEAIFCAFNIEFLQQSQNWSYKMLHYPFCIPSRRIEWYQEKRGEIKIMPHNGGMASAFLYIGKHPNRFIEGFSVIGEVVIPKRRTT